MLPLPSVRLVRHPLTRLQPAPEWRGGADKLWGPAVVSPVSARAVGLLAAGVVTALAMIAAIASYLPVVHNEPIPFDQSDPARLAIWKVAIELGSAALIAIGAWTIHAQRPWVAWGLAIAGAGVLLPYWATWSWPPAPVRAAVVASSPLAAAGISAVALRWSARPSLPARRELGAVWVLVAVAILIHLLAYNPLADPGCAGACDAVRPLLEGLLSSHSAVAFSCLLTIVAAAIAVGATVRTARRSTPRPVVIAVLCCAAALTMSAALRWATWGDVSPPRWRLLVEPLAVALVGVTVAVVGVRTARTRAAVGRLVVRLSRVEMGLSPTSGAIRGVHFAVPDDSGWVDSDGRDVSDLVPGGDHVVLSDQSGPVLRLILAERVDPGAVLAGLTPASRLALMNARLTALARARQADVQKSQKRIVAMSDAERRRIERDLHDGAQQRLVGAALHLRATVGSGDVANADGLLRAEAQLQTALAHLRQLAHGIFPNVLADEGLEAAIEDLASTSAVPVTIEVRMRGPIGSEITMAAYALVAAVLASVARPAMETRADVSVLADEMVVVRIAIAKPNLAQPPDLTDVADRIGAAGGRLTVSSEDPDTFIAEAVIPCAS